MDQQKTAQIKKQLATELDRVKKDLAKVADLDSGDHVPGDYAAKFPNYGDDSDSELTEYSPSEVEDYSKNLALTATLEKRMKAIEGALQRIAEGKYGYCTKCGKEIDPKRLAINPEAETCVACA